MSLATRMSASKLIHYFSSHPEVIRFWSSTPPDNITLTSANRKAYRSLSDLQTGVGAAAHATLDTEQLISHLRVALIDTLSSQPDAEGGVIPVSGVCELLLKVYVILDIAVSKWVGNSACILADVFNSVSRQHCEVWASQFPFLHSLRDVIPPSEVCLYGCINWSLALAQQQSSMGLSQCFPLRGVARQGCRLGSTSQCKRDLWQGLVVNLCPRGLTWRVEMRLMQVARSMLLAVSPPVLSILGEKGAVAVSTPDVSQSSASSSSSSAVFQVGMLFKFFNQWTSITSNRYVLNMVWGHHLQLWSCPPLFCNFWQFNVKVGVADHPIIQKEVDELLAKGAIEPSSGGAGFYSSMFVVPECTGGLWPICSLKHFNHYMHIPSFKMPTIRHVRQLTQHGDYALSFDLQDAYLHIPIVKNHHFFSWSGWHNVPYQWKVLSFGLATTPQVFTALTKPILCHYKGFCIVIYFDDILVLFHSKQAGKRAHSFLYSLLVWLGLHINFVQVWLLPHSDLLFLGVMLESVDMSVSLHPNKLADIQQLALSLLQNQYVTVHMVMSF